MISATLQEENNATLLLAHVFTVTLCKAVEIHWRVVWAQASNLSSLGLIFLVYKIKKFGNPVVKTELPMQEVLVQSLVG